MTKKHFLFLISIFLILIISGCATIETQPESMLRQPFLKGIYHTVKRGQTLWQISKAYNIDLKTLTEINNISDNSNIAIGQKIFIPERQEGATGELPEISFIWPIEGKIVSYYHSNQEGTLRKGLLIDSLGSDKVKATQKGTICFTHPEFKNYGKTVIISHNNNFYTTYSNLSDILVKVGDSVLQGEVIAKTKTSDQYPGSLLHFEIRKGVQTQNPLFFLPPR
ncbi:MAG: peptidoglycan DD-metalloendopeptidase family protein [Candidatus Omnitrophota bacterium]